MGGLTKKQKKTKAFGLKNDQDFSALKKYLL